MSDFYCTIFTIGTSNLCRLLVPGINGKNSAQITVPSGMDGQNSAMKF
jgi:hypothetical protein